MERLILKIGRLPDDDLKELEELTHRLRREIKELDVEKVDVIKSGKPPEGAKAGLDVQAWGSLVADVIPSVIPAIVGTVQSWIKPHEGRSVTLEIGGDKLQVSGISSEQQRELIKTWLNHHSTKTRADG